MLRLEGGERIDAVHALDRVGVESGGRAVAGAPGPAEGAGAKRGTHALGLLIDQ